VCGRGIEKEILKCLKRKVIEEENLKYMFTSFFSSHTEMSEGNYYKERSINVSKILIVGIWWTSHLLFGAEFVFLLTHLPIL